MFACSSGVSNDSVSAASAKSSVASTARSRCRFKIRFVPSTAWRGSAWTGTAWHGTAWHGTAWHGTAWYTPVTDDGDAFTTLFWGDAPKAGHVVPGEPAT